MISNFLRVLNVGLEFSRSSKNRERYFSSWHEYGTKKKNSESPWGIKPQTFRFWSEAQFLMGTQNFFLCPKLVTRPKTSFSISFPSPKLTISLILRTSSKKIKRKFMLTNLNLAFSYFSILIFLWHLYCNLV